MIGNNLTEFLDRVTSAEMEILNTEAGQEIVSELLEKSLELNPNMTAEEWAKIKQDFMVFLFSETMKVEPELMKELATHTYNEIRGENHGDY